MKLCCVKRVDSNSPTQQVEHPVATMHGLHKFLLFNVLACLGRNLSGSGIIGGGKAPENSMLYMASIQSDNKHVCGGFRISKDIVVTAARCDVNLDRAKVVLSTHKTDSAIKTVKYISKKCKHPSYEDFTKGNDIMLLEVEANKQCRVAGWGCTTPGDKTVDDLEVADVSIINLQVCKKKKWPDLSADVICAGGYSTKRTLCKGDFGGPLVCDGKAVGVASYNKCGNCINTNEPSIYTDISKFLPWINKVVKTNDWTDCKE
ncbi:mast cell protease 8-like isoform X3 [Epinephelus fuscoguttatus]|uniref:mast cell protease 8-like isoform X3 n=1 Tax=Epinephelus fuscoguttatus TaxID=293821 RepID=UPI0020D0892D|nr:mast cell protease 8-like isoform X3 [Epinephelus fuscoguttatus]